MTEARERIPQAIYDRTARCEACLFAQPYDEKGMTCHAEPPAREAPSEAIWPVVALDAWCGSYLPRDPK